MKTTALILILLSTLNAQLSTVRATPVTVRFDDIDRPFGNYNLGGLNFTGATKAGVGLGTGADGLVSVTIWYDPITGIAYQQDQAWAYVNTPLPLLSVSLTPWTQPVMPDVLGDEWRPRVSDYIGLERLSFLVFNPTFTCFFNGPDQSPPLDDEGYAIVPEILTPFTWGYSVQSITYGAVPEPSTIALLALGAATLVFYKSRSPA